MRLGKIDYLNLLPFEVFLKRFPLPLQSKQIVAHKKSYPSQLNRDFLFGRIDGGFLSSIMAWDRPHLALNCGIVAFGDVWSVLALPKEAKGDYQSASSNALIQVLGIRGEVLIGDRALKYKLQGGSAIDLGRLWWEKKKLPFVFGLFCVSKHRDQAKRLASHFAKSRVKIPRYVLQKASQKSAIEPADILEYLQHIHYAIRAKEKQGLKAFHRELRFLGLKKPKRFIKPKSQCKEQKCKKF